MDRFLVWFVIISIFCLFASAPFLIVALKKERSAFMKECLEDGNKHYQCQAMQNCPSARHTFTPIIIPRYK